MTVEYEIHGWHKDGPVYDEIHRGEGFRARKREAEVVSHGKRGGRNVASPQHHVIEHEDESTTVFLNRGFVYEILVEVDGSPDPVTVTADAVDEYRKVRIAPGLEVDEVREAQLVVDDDETVSDDEDDVATDDEGSVGEEE